MAKRQAQVDAERVPWPIGSARMTLTLKARVGSQDRLYGSITSADIAAALGNELGTTFDRRKLVLEEPIRELGTHTVPVHLARDVTTSLTVNVEAEEVTTPAAGEQVRLARLLPLFLCPEAPAARRAGQPTGRVESPMRPSLRTPHDPLMADR